MPWRLILFAVFIVLLVVFVGVNLENACTVSLIFVTYPDVPVYISILISFALGMIIMIPFTFGKKSSHQDSGRPPRNRNVAGRKSGVKPDLHDPADDIQPVARPINDD